MMMRCEELSRQQADALRDTGRDDPAFVRHAATCRDCGDALRASRVLALQRAAPALGRDAFERTMAAVLASTAEPRRLPRAGFWTGIAVGAAAAAIVAAFMLPALLLPPGAPQAGLPHVALALAEPQDVSIAIEVHEALAEAEIHVILQGAVELYGYEGQRDVHWTTDLEQGINQLTLPVVVNDAAGGAVVVEVHHGGKRKSFQVAVQSLAEGDAV